MFMRIRLAAGHTHISANLLEDRELALIGIGISGIRYKRDLGHFGYRNAREMVIAIYIFQ
jgi:hypothetical protein